MASVRVIVPDFEFSAFYYADILRRLRIFNRVNAPEISSEVAEEPFIQAERSFALVGHLNNVLLDLAANEVLLPTAKLADSVRLLLELIDFQMRDYSPAVAELLLELRQVATASVQVLEGPALFETERTEESVPVPFEILEELYLGPTNVVDGVFAVEKDRGGTDGATILGDPSAFESAAMAVSVADINKEVEIEGSILGNNGVFVLAAVLQTGGTSRIRLASTLGGDDPLFIRETGLTWTIRTWSANAASDVNTAGAPFWTPWTDVEAGDKLYVGSEFVLWSELDAAFQTPGANIAGVWEYYDPDLSDETPDDVVNLGSTLFFELTSFLGGADRSGARIRLTYLPTGVFEDVKSVYALGINSATSSAFLGQSGTPSVDPGDYAVGSDWNPLSDQVDGTSDLSSDGKVEYTLPQTLRENWQSLLVQNVEGWFLRYRVVSVAAPVEPIVDTLEIDEGSQFVLQDAVQGETVGNEPLLSSNGQPGQEFVLATSPGLRDTVEGFVDEGGGEIEWTNLTAIGKTLVTSGPKDRHFVVEQDALGVLTARFGDGTRGKIPPLGTDNIRFSYRSNATEDGNVGSDTIVVNSDGSAFVKTVTNPRPASGWREADGASEESLALVKEEGPASIRTGNRAVNPEDYENLALAFESEDGTRPIVRAKAIEEGFGPKTMKLIVVGTRGVAISASLKEQLEEYFNGDPVTGLGGVGQANTETTVVNFNPRLFSITIIVEANDAVSEDLVKTTLGALISPTSRESDGSTFVWRFGGRVPNSRIESEVFQSSPGNVFDADVTTPATDTELLEDELPFLDLGTLNISIVPPTT